MQVSSKLRELAAIYLTMVDEKDQHMGTPERDRERTFAHEALMDEMEECGIPFNSRYEARWLARWIVANNTPNFDTQPVLYWAKPNGENDWFKELRYVPPEDNREGWIPVVIKCLPITEQRTVFERNHS